MIPKPKLFTPLVSLIGNGIGLYLAYKNKKTFWGYAGYFFVGGLSGSIVGYAVDSGISEIKKSLEKPPKPSEPVKLTETEAKELVKKLAVGRYTPEGQKQQDDIRKQIEDAGFTIKLNPDSRTYSISPKQSNFKGVPKKIIRQI